MLDQQYEAHAIAFKRRRTVAGAMRAHARKISSILMETPETAVSDFDDYLFTSLVRCNGDGKQDLLSLELVARECVGRHEAEMLQRLPNLQWIVLVGKTSHQLLSRPDVWQLFLESINVRDTKQALILPLLDHGVSDVLALNQRISLIAVPHFSSSVFTAAHYRRVFSSWLTSRPLKSTGASRSLSEAPRAAGPL